MTQIPATMDPSVLLDNSTIFLTRGGIETTTMFHTDFPLRDMASFEHLFHPEWNQYTTGLDSSFANVALRYNRPLILDTDTWRASTNWFNKLGTSEENRQQVSTRAYESAAKTAKYIIQQSNGKLQPFIQGVMGPMADAYKPNDTLTIDTARVYHRPQVLALKQAGLPLVLPASLSNSVEAAAIVMEANDAAIKCAVAFTIDIDGKLPSGESLKDAITAVDSKTNPPPLFYMVSCIHPRYVKPLVSLAQANNEPWINRLRGIRGNASLKSHEELDNSDQLDEGIPQEWAQEMLELHKLLPSLNILGGCCGTSVRHCEELAKLLGAAKI